MDSELNSNYLDCIRDSPKFRKNVNLSFTKIVDFQDVITEISDSFTQSIKSGIVFSCHYQLFCSKIEKLNKLCLDNEHFQNDFNRIIKIFSDFKEHFKSLMESFHVIQKDFKSFLEHFKEIESCKKLFQKTSDNLDNAQQKCASIQKSKSNECNEVDSQCTTARKEFTQSSLSYMTNIEKYEIYKHSLFLRACTGIIANKCKYYSQGNEFMNNSEPWIDHLKNSKMKYDNLYEKKSSEINDVVYKFCNGNIKNVTFNDSTTKIEGYLYKWPRKSWQKWQRRWFRIENNQLLSCKRTDDCFSVVEDDLRMCTARELLDTDRRFCFELIGLDHTHVLQADDEVTQKRWIECFQSGMSSQMDTLRKQSRRTSNGTNHDVTSRKKSSISSIQLDVSKKDSNHNKNEDRKSRLLGNVLTVKGNSVCCDCNDGKPRWASSSLGITLCTECSGAHRSLGVHISKVRSLTLDNWEPEMLCVMFMLGNDVVNRIFESDTAAISRAATESGIIKPDTSTDMAARKLWAKAKWEKKQFVRADVRELLEKVENYVRDDMAPFASGSNSSTSLPGECQQPFTTAADLLRRGLQQHCLPLMLLALALNANPNGELSDHSHSDDDSDCNDCIPLHMAASSGFWPGCEFLILNGAKIDIVDKNKQTALHKACQNENVLVVWLLLKRGARQNIRDSNDNEVLQIAMSTTNANTVTLLRLQMLNENTKEANLGSSGDETVNDVFRDFTNRAFDQIDEWFSSDTGRLHRMNNSKSLINNVYL